MKFYTSIVIQTIFFSCFLNKLWMWCISYCSTLNFIILLGYLFNLYKGVSQDLTAAARWFRQAAAPGDLIAQPALPELNN